MEWTKSETLALAAVKCTHCEGLGSWTGRKGMTVCNCVLRATFRACFNRFQDCVYKEKYMSRPTLQAVRGRSSNMCWGRKDEEYIVDFLNIAKRTLSEPEHQVFRFHFLLGADWKMCCRRLGIDRGTFFHTVYRLQQHLGRALAETKPYALFPLDEYFNGSTRLEVHSAADITPVVRKGAKPRIDVPVRLAA